MAEGTVEGWYEENRADLEPGDVLFAPVDTVHAVYNTSQAVVLLLIMLSPLVATTDEDWELAAGYGWEMTDVSEEAPWNELR